MILRSVVMLLFLPALAAAGDLCGKYERKIDPDMQIRESDLSTENARDAAADLQRILQRDVDAKKNQFATMNRLQVMVGYTLRQVALEDIAQYGKGSTKAQGSEKKFCNWLVEKGFWYD